MDVKHTWILRQVKNCRHFSLLTWSFKIKLLIIRYSNYPFYVTWVGCCFFLALVNYFILFHLIFLFTPFFYQESNDWFYALRWVPSRYLANRLKGFSDRTAGSAESLLMYRAHRMLSPSKADKEQSLRNHNLNATQYR